MLTPFLGMKETIWKPACTSQTLVRSLTLRLIAVHAIIVLKFWLAVFLVICAMLELSSVQMPFHSLYPPRRGVLPYIGNIAVCGPTKDLHKLCLQRFNFSYYKACLKQGIDLRDKSVINRVSNVWSGKNIGKGKSQFLVLNANWIFGSTGWALIEHSWNGL